MPKLHFYVHRTLAIEVHRWERRTSVFAKPVGDKIHPDLIKRERPLHQPADVIFPWHHRERMKVHRIFGDNLKGCVRKPVFWAPNSAPTG